MKQIVIEKAVCMIPRRGRQAHIRRQREEFRKEHPELAAEADTWPWMEDPDHPDTSDDNAVFYWTWTVIEDENDNDGEDFNWRSYLPLSLLERAGEHGFYIAAGPVKLRSIAGVEDDGKYIDYSFPVKASYAVEVLRHAKQIADVEYEILNEDDMPRQALEELEEEEE